MNDSVHIGLFVLFAASAEPEKGRSSGSRGWRTLFVVGGVQKGKGREDGWKT